MRDNLDLSSMVGVLSANCPSAISAWLSASTCSIGGEYWVYARDLPLVEALHPPMILGGYPAGWVDHYFSCGYLAVDPVIAHCSRRITPCIWPTDTSSLPRQRRFFGEAAEFGLASGVSIPLHGPGAVWGLLSVASSERDPRDLARWASTLMLLAAFAHEAAGTLQVSRGCETPPHLTRRELECLNWAAIGKGSWEIGRLLGITERTVIFHLQNACTKLCVCTRMAAVARAISTGLINP